MKKTIRELTEDLLAAPSACKEIKDAAQNYLDAVGTKKEADTAKAFVAEMEADIMPIDGLISFAESDMGAKVFGADGVKNVLLHAKERKAAGEKYCDCPACAACEALLAKKDEILKNIKERKIYNYVYPQIISVEITVNPENKNLMNI